MASSDNVLRGGLTPKHVNVPELLRVMDFRDGPVEPVPIRTVCPHECEYLAPVGDFRLSVLEIDAGQHCRPERRGAELLLCLRGRATVEAEGSEAIELARGESLYVPAGDGRYRITGEALVYRATVGNAGAQAAGASPQ
jgi:mannose-6-phosphate isomerase